MKEIGMLFLLGLIGTPAAAQSDLCWRDPYSWIPGQWAGSASVIEAGNRFQVVTGATVELWATTYKYNAARQSALRHQMLPASLVETTQSDGHGAFVFKTLQGNKEVQPASFEIRVHMPGTETGSAYTEIGTGLAPQWMGRGIKVGLSQEGKGCSRIYSAGLDDTDCGVLDCEKLPAGPAKSSSPMELRWLTSGWPFISTARREVKILNSLSPSKVLEQFRASRPSLPPDVIHRLHGGASLEAPLHYAPLPYNMPVYPGTLRFARHPPGTRRLLHDCPTLCKVTWTLGQVSDLVPRRRQESQTRG